VYAGQLQLQVRDASDASAGIGFDNATFAACAPFSDNEAVNDERLVKRGDEGVSGPVSLRR
jgi:hypothetical protein